MSEWHSHPYHRSLGGEILLGDIHGVAVPMQKPNRWRGSMGACHLFSVLVVTSLGASACRLKKSVVTKVRCHDTSKPGKCTLQAGMASAKNAPVKNTHTHPVQMNKPWPMSELCSFCVTRPPNPSKRPHTPHSFGSQVSHLDDNGE